MKSSRFANIPWAHAVKTRLPPHLPPFLARDCQANFVGGLAVIRFTWKAKRAKCTTRCNTGQQYVIHFNRTRCLALRCAPPGRPLPLYVRRCTAPRCTRSLLPSTPSSFAPWSRPGLGIVRHSRVLPVLQARPGQARPGNWFPRNGGVSGIGD